MRWRRFLMRMEVYIEIVAPAVTVGFEIGFTPVNVINTEYGLYDFTFSATLAAY
jgi:hypothetical protein